MNATMLPTQWNGTGDGAVQRAEALKALHGDANLVALVYGADGTVAVDPKYGGDFYVLVGQHDAS